MDLADTVKKFDQAKEVIITWFSVLTRGPNAFEQMDLEKSSTLFYALRFMLYMSFVDVLLHLPAIAQFGAKNIFIEPVWILETYLEYLVIGFVLYGSMKLFGGKGTLQACTTAYCFLTAYLPIMGVLMLPTHRLIISNMADDVPIPVVSKKIYDQLSQLSVWEVVGLCLSFLLSTVVFVLFFVSVFRAFRRLHRLNAAPALLAFVLGLVGSVVVLIFFLGPMLSAVLPKRVH